MPRTLHADVITALDSDNLRWIALAELVFDEVTLRFCTRLASFTVGANTYTGLGSIGSISSISENNSLDPSTCTLTLSTIDTGVLATLANYEHINRKARVFFALLDEDDALIGEPILFFDGSMDEIDLAYGRNSRATIKLKDRLADWDRKQSERWSHEEQQALYPGDRGFEDVASLENKTIIWPGQEWRP